MAGADELGTDVQELRAAIADVVPLLQRISTDGETVLAMLNGDPRRGIKVGLVERVDTLEADVRQLRSQLWRSPAWVPYVVVVLLVVEVIEKVLFFLWLRGLF